MLGLLMVSIACILMVVFMGMSGFLAALAMIGLFALFASIERRTWNRGQCKCGSPLEYFDTDSQGGRGYVCRSCNRTVWISYPWVDGLVG